MMLERLKDLERNVLPDLLNDPDAWNSLDINYHPPRVERLWKQWGEERILLHYIHPCTAEEALFHTHEWQSAMHVVAGRYKMSVGYGKGTEVPPVMMQFESEGDFYYDMTDGDMWHSVQPLSPVMTVMLISKPCFFDRPAFKSDRPLGRVEEERKLALLGMFRAELVRRELIPG